MNCLQLFVVYNCALCLRGCRQFVCCDLHLQLQYCISDFSFLADRCNAMFGYCHEMSSVVCLSSVVCNTRILWPNRWTDQDETWHAGRPRRSEVK